ncbi:MAG TPA: extracellular solute-binding protein [Xanthobacteraceae bacterium]|nr:extracellular solute-binding protein [Xanthobacteraceae bacterium]
MNRRSLLTSAALALAARGLPLPAWTTGAAAQGAKPVWRHGASPFGDLKYPAGFPHFDYVNVKAPKSGSARQIALGTFDNFNPVVGLVKGALVQGTELLYDTLLAPALDEVSAGYGLLAEALSHPNDFSSVSFRLRPEAKWHDGTPVTPDDVIFSFTALKKSNPQAMANYHEVVKAEKTGDREVTFTFNGPGHHTLPQTIGQLTVFPKAWWEGADKDGKNRDIGSTTLEPPLGSGPYRIKEFQAGRSIVYERVPDYWGSALNVNLGSNNFDELRFDYFRDATVAIEAFKAGTVDWRIENSAKNWATAYDFPAVSDGRVIKEEFAINNVALMQAFAFNLRRAKFQDSRLRLAFNYAFNFEDMNKELFFGQYKRTSSYFEGTDLAATGLPSAAELELLEPLRDKIPAEVFKKAYSNPICGNPAAVRDNLREALRLLKAAGYEIRDQALTNVKTGEPFTIELLSNVPLFERVFLFYKPSLERLGIEVTVRTVDEPQYENRLRNWDFDIIIYSWGDTLLPGNELRDNWSTAAADQPGSENIVGIKNPAVDAMVERIIAAKNRPDLVAAARALDRILLWNHYVVPQWNYNKLRTARWDRFSHHEPLPKYGISAFPTVWWWDADKAAKAGARS